MAAMNLGGCLNRGAESPSDAKAPVAAVSFKDKAELLYAVPSDAPWVETWTPRKAGEWLAKVKKLRADLRPDQPETVIALYDEERWITRVLSNMGMHRFGDDPEYKKTFDSLQGCGANPPGCAGQGEILDYIAANLGPLKVEMDLGGDYYVAQTDERLRKIEGTKAGRAKRFQQSLIEVFGQAFDVCFNFPGVDDEFCSEGPDGEYVLPRIRAWADEFKDAEFADARRKALEVYIRVIKDRQSSGWVASDPYPKELTAAKIAKVLDPYVGALEKLLVR